MTRRSTCSSIVSLSLAFLLTGLVACSSGSEGEETPTPSTEAGATPAPGSPAQPGQPAMSPSSAQPGAMPSGPPADTSAIPAVVARVNGVDITKADLLHQVDQMRVMGQARGRQLPPMDAGFFKKLLEGMVAQTLILQDAKAQSVTVTDAEVDGQVAALRSRLQSAGVTSEQALGMNEAALKTYVREQATVQKYMMTIVFNSMTVSDQQAREFYEQNKAQMQRPERVHLRHILVRVEPNAAAADKQKAKAKAEDLLKQAQGGADFAKLASENSDDPGSKVNGGDLSWITRGQTVPPFEQASFALTKPNQLSAVVESQYGYHIIQLVEREAPAPLTFEEAKGRIEQMLKQRQASEKGQAKVEELKKKGKVEVFL